MKTLLIFIALIGLLSGCVSEPKDYFTQPSINSFEPLSRPDIEKVLPRQHIVVTKTSDGGFDIK